MTEDSSDYRHPLPELEGLTQEFYDLCKEGTLHFQRCAGCRAWRHVPREMCPECGSWDWAWAPSTGRGKVFSWTVVARALHPAFKDDTPYAPVIVEMDEGVRLLTQVTDVAPDALEIDMPVEVAFDAVTPEITLPRFRRAAA
ncbi:MAG: OB-fold domain-containing protein [Deltaproteobacteria bacterium]|nr:OB-fold domain-containing protein [Deltaproteobacteria bacterium]